MKATEAKLLDFLKKSPQFVIPIYQRTYSWTEPECQQLWSDIIRSGSDDQISAHFIGSIVYIEQGLYQISSQSPMLVIDGQQRLTTVALILEALARKLGDDPEPIEGFSAKKLRNYYLLNPLEEGERKYKLILTQTDKQSLLSVLDQKPFPEDSSIRLDQNFRYFEKKIAALEDDLEPLCRGLAKLLIVDISLNRDQDNPQLIFESMNSTGRELSQADLIRNFILMGLEPEHQNQLYVNHWRQMELAFGQESYGQHFDGFMRHYLTAKTDEIPKVREVYDAFKAYSRRAEVSSKGIDSLVAELQEYAGYYCAMALGKETVPTLARAFADLRELKVDVAYPLLLELYKDYARDYLTMEDFAAAVRLIESYVFRRAICGIPTNSMNKTFANFGKQIRKDSYLESIEAHFLLLPSYRRFPNDEEFSRDLQKRDLYNFRNRSYLLRRLENHDRKERVSVDEYTIEHIMPQSEDLSSDWREELGQDWKRAHEDLLHTLGNLTLTGYNSEYSNHPFQRKRDMVGGFRESPLRLNEGLRDLDEWNETEIRNRAEKLSRKAMYVWRSPILQADVLDLYRPQKQVKQTVYSIDDHKYLAEDGITKEIFEAFRNQIIALDPCVSEEIRKLYVAYKAETNFVDVIPQAKGIRLSINLDFHELHDPRGIARDIAGKQRWGNGNVEVKVNSVKDIPYVVGLTRQAFENQMGNHEAES